MVTRSQQIDVLDPKGHGDQRPVKLCPYMEWTDLLEYSQQAQHCEHKRIIFKCRQDSLRTDMISNDLQKVIRLLSCDILTNIIVSRSKPLLSFK